MEEFSREDLLKKESSIYKLCNLAAMRSRELNEGMKRLVAADPHDKVTTIAIREIANDKVKIKSPK
jgi:DNA-directed RNA polymerase omega subunit